MTAGALGEERPTLFLRKATGLVRGWNVRDSMIYACLATNFVTLGIYEFTFAGPAFPTGQLITAVVISGIWVSFLSYTLDAVLVIAVTFLFSLFDVVILPWRKRELWQASPASKIKVLGVPIVPAAGLITIGLLVFNLYEWLSNASYFVNKPTSLYYMAGMYVLAIVIYVGARLIRSRQGIDLGLVNKEIPVE